MQTTWRDFVTALAIAVVRIYQNILSPMLFHSCRFFPTCSQYAIESLERFGLVGGGWRTLRRVLRCRPFSRGGFDPAC